MGVPQFPQTLPADTVVGRLGIGPGPAQAIPFTTAFSRAITVTVTPAGLEFVADGGGAVLTTGLKAFLEVPFDATITAARLFADRVGSIVLDVWKCTYSQFDAGVTHPVLGDAITSVTPPTITAATKSENTTLTNWTVALHAGDVLGFNITSVSSIKRVTLSLDVARGGGDARENFYETRTAAVAAFIITSVTWLQTEGYTTVGDYGGAFYVKVAVQPTHPGKFQSADGAWWELTEADVTLEMFGAVGDGIVDDGQAYIDAWAYITFKTTGHILLEPGQTYFIDTSALADQAIFTTVANCKSVGIIGRGGILQPNTATYPATQFSNYLTWFQGCSDILLRDFEIVAFSELGFDATTALRGLNMFVFDTNGAIGCRRIEVGNIKQTGGMHLLWASVPNGALEAEESRHFLIYNVETVQTHYPIQFSFGHRYINIYNYKTTNATRSLFTTNVKHLYAEVYSTGHQLDDIVLEATYNPGVYFDALVEDVHVKYSCDEIIDHNFSMVAMVWRTDAAAIGAQMRNITLEYHVNMANLVGNISMAYAVRQTVAGAADVGAARGHVCEGLTIKGYAYNASAVNATSVFRLFDGWPVGELVRDLRFENLTVVADYNVITLDTTPLIGYTSFANVTIDGDLSLIGTPKGEIHLQSFNTNNILVLSAAFAKLVETAGIYVRTDL